MKRKIFTHKILPIVAIFMFVLFTLTTSCFASDVVFNNQTYVTSSEYDSFDYHLVVAFTYTKNGEQFFYYRVFVGNEPIICTYSSGSYSFRYQSKQSIIVNNGNPSSLADCFNCTDFSNSAGVNIQNDIAYVYTDHDIYDMSGNLVFQAPPQEKPAEQEIQQVELMKPTQVEEIPAQIVGIVRIVLPIFLTIFGILLVLYLIKSKNLLQL